MVSFFREIIVSSRRPLIPTVPSLVRAAQAMGCTGPGLHGYSDAIERRF